MPKLCISRSICSLGSCIDGDDLVIMAEQTVSAEPAIQRCLFICGIVYRFAGSKTNILRIRLSQSMKKITKRKMLRVSRIGIATIGVVVGGEREREKRKKIENKKEKKTKNTVK